MGTGVEYPLLTIVLDVYTVNPKVDPVVLTAGVAYL